MAYGSAESTHRLMRIRGALAVVAALSCGMAGCSGGALGAPSVEDLTDALMVSADFSALHSLGYADADVQAAAECTARTIRESMSEKSLAIVASGKFDSKLTESEYGMLTNAMMECALENFSMDN